MRIPKILLIALLAGTCFTASAQKLTQIIRGQVMDSESQTPLAFATIALITTDSLFGTTTDDQGNFRFEKVPVGRHDIKVSYMGYETQLIPELMVSTGKEMVLTIKMKEQVSQLEEVVIKAYAKKDKPLNTMATLSARTFSVEEARRYAGGFDDPARLASSFAGITTENLRDNTIVIRGNSPKGLLWRLEGIEVPNPNHFANLATFGGGGVSALSALVVGNSDFYTGAFPAEYGNAVSGVFDIRLRNGNNEQYEHAVQLGTMGIDVSSEGPLGKGSGASYIFNYRYSTLGLVKVVFPEEIKDFIPVYQDLCFKFNIPTKKSGIFSVWGLASDDKDNMDAEQDSSHWEMSDDRIDADFTQRMGGLGLNHSCVFQKNACLNTSLAVTGDYMKYEAGILGYDLNRYDKEYINVLKYKYTFTSVLNRKFSAKHTNRTGFIVDHMRYYAVLKHAPVYNQGLITVVDEKDASNMVQVFSQSKFNVTKRLAINAGLHGHYFNLNREPVLEPRLGVTYNIGRTQSVSLAYGKHSRLEPLTLYFARVDKGTGITRPNKDLKVSKAHHLVLAYDVSLTPNLRLKIEPYIQFLYDVPVIPDSNFSVLNFEADWYFDQPLTNTGTGYNTGIDITLERFLKDGYYFLFTASLFDSKFRGDDGILRNTRFNTRYIVNLLFGKEWTLGRLDNKILGVNARVNFFGGKRATPVDYHQSVLAGEVVYDYSRLFEDKESDTYFVSAAINYRINKKNHSSIWSFQMINLLLTKENYGLYYNYKTRQVERFEFAVPVPSLSYRIEF
ncbi:MAG: TonB-dependent receptor [Bacteroidales bacterium]|nr:TonB-dependent receptor [Bacteroidales bacterium]